MIRITVVISAFILSISPALAGFEWVAPSQVGTTTKAVEAIDTHSGFAPPSVEVPTSIAPPQVTATLSGSLVSGSSTSSKRNLSGKKLVIDPYPLRNNVPPPQDGMTTGQIYKSMNEASGNLNPVQLGNGMKTNGVLTRARVSVPPPERMASTSQTYNNAQQNPPATSMTPMMGGEPAPLHGVEIPREPIMNQQSQGQFANAIGFGRELPLALALSQVVPSDFTHSYAQGVDSGATVSWEGGKPWNEVLNEMLRPASLIAVVRGKQVVIQPLASL